MMGFMEWVEFNRKKKEKENKNERSTSQAGQQNGAVGNEGQAARNDTKEYSTVVHNFTQSKWEDYRGGD